LIEDDTALPCVFLIPENMNEWMKANVSKLTWADSDSSKTKQNKAKQ
jgi:hypothetical protein